MRNKKMITLIIGIVALILFLVGTTYAVFQYRRSGALNNLGTGRVYFNSTQSDTLNLTNAKPMSSENLDASTLDAVTINIVGDTSYDEGEEYLISIGEVNNTVNNKRIPLNFIAEISNTGNLGVSSNNYWNDRENPSSSIYTLNSTGQVEEGKQILVGFIRKGSTGINGSITIKAYIDADYLMVSDTLEDGAIEVPGYTNNVTEEEVAGRTVLTTAEWNSLVSTPISFKIRAEADEGLWVSHGTIDSCPGCKFLYLSNYVSLYTDWADSTLTPSDYYENYEDVISESGKDFFLGVKLNSNNKITNAYACGIKDNVPFCIEGEDTTKYASNVSILQGANLYNNTCIEYPDSETGAGFDYYECGPWDNSSDMSAYITSDGSAYSGNDMYNNYCAVYYDGQLECYENSSSGGDT